MNSLKLSDAQVRWDGRKLEISTGRLERAWTLTPHGLATTLLRDRVSGRTWNDAAVETGSDWSVFVVADGTVPGSLLSFESTAVTDDPQATPHLQCVALFRYPYLDSHFDLRWTVMVYPEVAGVRTQIALKAGRDFGSEEIPSFMTGSFSERFPFSPGSARRIAAGYYNDTQHRNFNHTPLLKEEIRDAPIQARESYDWANILCIEEQDSGIALVKESHKCVNQPGFDTGDYVVWPAAVGVTGLGYDPAGNCYLQSRKYADPERFTEAWATWMIAYGEDRHTAIKRFDRARFIPRPEIDLRIKSNTWGSRGSGDASRGAATELNVLREIESCADLGIDSIEIDDGWQHDARGEKFTPTPIVWRPRPDRFPDGWRKVREASAAAGVQLALWAPGHVPAADLLWNIEAGGFDMMKLDFLNFRIREDLDAFIAKVCEVEAARSHHFRVNFDLTENAIRLGYFYGREHGVLFISNRQLPEPNHKHVAYNPHLQLREAWHLAHYLNLNQTLLTMADPDTVPAAVSTAHRYSHSYCLATTLMGLPLLFMETHTLSTSARDELRPLIATYKEHRASIHRGIVSPVGDEPSDAGWSGLISHDDATSSGYVLVFREQASRESHRAILLPPLENAQALQWFDLRAGQPMQVARSQTGWNFALSSPADFGFYRYSPG